MTDASGVRRPRHSPGRGKRAISRPICGRRPLPFDDGRADGVDDRDGSLDHVRFGGPRARFDFTRALRRLFTGARTGGGSSRCNRPGRTMKRTLAATVASAAALTATGLAVARNLDSNTNVRAVAGTFAATTASRVDTKTCTTTDGKTLVTTTGTYTGASTGDADLTGNATVHARSTINTTDNVGVVSGSLKIDVASGRDTQADFTAVYSGGSLAGLRVRRGHDPAATLAAT